MTNETYWVCVSALQKVKDHHLEVLYAISGDSKLFDIYTWKIESIDKALEELDSMRD